MVQEASVLMGQEHEDKSLNANKKDLYLTRRGERNPKAKLTDDDVRLIRALGREGISHRVLARKFEVGKNAVESVLNGKTWKHVR